MQITQEQWNELNELDELVMYDLLAKLNQGHGNCSFIVPPKNSLQRLALKAGATQINLEFEEYQTRLQEQERNTITNR